MKNIQKLLETYQSAVEVDQYTFADQRSNILLTSGDHYAKRTDFFYRNVRESPNLDRQTRIRLVKNHAQRIIKTYVNNIVSSAPNVAITAKDEKDLKNQKQAELNYSVWLDICEKNSWDEKVNRFAYDYVAISETFCKIFWNPYKGKLIAHQETGEIADDGSPVTLPVYEGELEIEPLYAFNMMRCPSAKSLTDSPYLIHRKMVSTPDLKKKFPEANELGYIKDTKDDTFKVFDGYRGTYRDTKDETMVMEFFYRPCLEYPKGYFYICTEKGILSEGELPFGEFPILFCGWDEIPTSARHYSLMKALRPPQLELNRTASKIAETQMVAGDVKIVSQYGSKMSQGALLPGIRHIQMNGTPTVVPGQSGEQYFDYMKYQIEEMYQLANLDLELMEKDSGAIDPTTFLFRSLRQKKVYALYVAKFERYLTQICNLSLRLARQYYTDQQIIPAVGRSEMINISDFKQTDSIFYSVHIEAQSGDIETKMGKYMTIQNLLQYVGSQLSQEQIGNLVRNMEYVNKEQIFDDATLNYDMATNIILALDRGNLPQVRETQPHEYIISKLTARTLKPDYEFLPMRNRQLYEASIMQHKEMLAEVVRKQQAAQAGLIPTTGYMVACDLYVPKADDPTKTQRARVPYDSIQWLIQKIEDQGTTLQAMEALPPSIQGDIGMMSQNLQPVQTPQPQG